MIDRTNMTIDAYLRQAGLKPQTTETTKRFIALKPLVGMDFDQVMEDAGAEAEKTTGGQNTGKTIADYLNQRTSSAVNALFTGSTLSGGRFGTDLAALESLNQTRSPRGDAAAAGIEATNRAAGGNDDITTNIRQAARKYDLPVTLIENVIQAESNFQADAVSPAGAQGLMQLMPATARELGVTDAFDVSQNIDGGSRYLRQMLDRFNGDVKLALAAYNAGPGAVERHGGNVPPYKETQAYVERILTALKSSGDAVA